MWCQDILLFTLRIRAPFPNWWYVTWLQLDFAQYSTISRNLFGFNLMASPNLYKLLLELTSIIAWYRLRPSSNSRQWNTVAPTQISCLFIVARLKFKYLAASMQKHILWVCFEPRSLNQASNMRQANFAVNNILKWLSNCNLFETSVT